MEKLVSVVIPTYQRGNLIDRALTSVFNQSGIGDWAIEAIVVDDGSTDNTEAVVRGISVPAPHRVIYHRVEHIGKPGLVRNIGLKLGSGEFVGYCDSDDIWLPHHLATCLRQFTLHPDTVMVETWWSFQQLFRGARRWQINYASASTDGRTTTTNSRIHRRSVLAKVGYFNELAWGEDIDLWTRIGFAGPIRRVKMPTTAHAYIRGGNNITFTFNPEIAAEYDGQPSQPKPEQPPPAEEVIADLPTPVISPADPVAMTSGRRWRRRIAYSIEHPRAAARLLAQRTLPTSIRGNRWIRRISKKLLGIPWT